MGDGALARGLVIAALWALALGAPAGAEPLDPFDPTPRPILVELEVSTDPGVVGQAYGSPLPASYSASGGIGTVVIPVASHEPMRSGSFDPIPGSFTPIVIEIDLGDLSAASQSASGAFGSGGLLTGFLQDPLGTDSVAGHMTIEGAPLFCTSQQEVDDQCQVDPIFCGVSCVLVPGAPYDPGTGRINLVGSETVEGCDGSFCFGPFLFFSQAGDLRLSEVTPLAVPAPGPLARIALAVSLLLAGRVALVSGRHLLAGRASPCRAA